MTTKFPSLLILIQLVEELRARNSLLTLTWPAREKNEEADAWTNSEFSAFSESLRIHVDPSQVKWILLPQLEKSASDLFQLTSALKKSAASTTGLMAQRLFSKKKKSVKDRLKWKDPWWQVRLRRWAVLYDSLANATVGTECAFYVAKECHRTTSEGSEV